MSETTFFSKFLAICIVATPCYGQALQMDVLISNGGIVYNMSKDGHDIQIILNGPKDPYDTNYVPSVDIFQAGRRVATSPELIRRLIEHEIVNQGEKLPLERQAFLSLLMFIQQSDLRVKRWGLSLHEALSTGNWQHAFVKHDPLEENYDFGAPFDSKKTPSQEIK